MKLMIAPCTLRYTDYGDLLETVTGIVWLDSDGHPMKGGFERKTVEEKHAQIAPYLGALDANGEPLELVVCEPIVRTIDMNPHGLM